MIPTWLAFAMFSPLLWAIVHVLDSYCVERVFDRPWMGVITSALATALVLPFVAVVIGFQSPPWPSWDVIALALLCGAIFQISQGLYFQALSYSEAGIVAAYWNMVPMLLAVLSWLLFGRVLEDRQYFGIILLVSASVSFCLIDSELKTRWRTLLLMFVAAWLQVAYFLLQKIVFENCSVLLAFGIISLGMTLTGSFPLVFGKIRSAFVNNSRRFGSAIALIIGIEVINLGAIGTSQIAVDRGQPELVAAVESTMPAYTFSLSFLLLYLLPKFGDEKAKRLLTVKLILVAVMACGIWLVSRS